MSLIDLSHRADISNVNLSRIKTGKIKAIRFSTLNALCDILDCQPGDILEFARDEDVTNSDILVDDQAAEE